MPAAAPSTLMDALVARLDAARRSWFTLPAGPDVPAGLRVQLVRPSQVEMLTGYKRTPFQMACDQVDGWEGFTEAVFLGAAIGSDTVVPFEPRVWERWVGDRVGVTLAIYEEVIRQSTEFLKLREEQSGN